MSRLPTVDDVLAAVPLATVPASTIVRAAELYLRGHSTRAVAR